mmetsp:Transcript_78651/g.138951  ORF Transcript_78651/g.138951 Transcript_78651/m.138951 type:complete len:82 (+) Transcript_78651:1723-1968(+)
MLQSVFHFVIHRFCLHSNSQRISKGESGTFQLKSPQSNPQLCTPEITSRSSMRPHRSPKTKITLMGMKWPCNFDSASAAVS